MGSVAFPHLFMDPLNELWNLYETTLAQVGEKPELQDELPASTGNPNEGDYSHPVIQQRKQVDTLRKAGVDPTQAHQQVYGDVDLADTDSKKELAATLGRVQDDGSKKGIKIEKDGEVMSLLALDDEITQKLDQVTASDLRTPAAQEIPDKLQDPEETPLTQEEEYDYNMDVAYLQKFGRA